MDPVNRVKDYLLDNIGHMTFPGNPSFDNATQHWHVPVFCRTANGPVVVGDIELNKDGHITYAPGREAMLASLTNHQTVAAK